MVRVHVRPPFGRRPLGRLEIFGNGQGRRPATALWAGIRAASRQVENVPRAFVRGGQTHFSLKGVRGAWSAVHRRFFVKQQTLGSELHAGPAWRRFWRPGCTGARRMPWRRQAMKDAASCEKPRGGACGLRSGGFRMGQPAPREGGAPARTHMAAGARPGEVKHLSSRRKRRQR